MVRPPLDPRERPLAESLTWQSIAVSYALMAVIPLLLWAVSRPLAGSVLLVGAASLFIGGRRAYRLRRCFYDCQEFTFDVLGRARITVAQIPTAEAK